MTELRLPALAPQNLEQTINPWTFWLRATGVEVGQLNVYMGNSGAPEVEKQILDTVGSYGRQIGQIGDALAVLLKHVKLDDLEPDEKTAIDALQAQLLAVDVVKRQASLKPALEASGGPA